MGHTDTQNPIRKARREANLTLEQLAVRARVSSTTLSIAERAGLISKRTATKLARVLRVPIDQLLERSRAA